MRLYQSIFFLFLIAGLASANCEPYLGKLIRLATVMRSLTIDMDPRQLPPGLTKTELLSSIFRYHDEIVNLAFKHKNDLAHALIGPREGRPSYVEVGKENLGSIKETIEMYRQGNFPIEGVTFWGGARQYGRGKNLGVDASDLFALLRFEAMNQSVANSGYQPGIKVRVVFEDLGRRFMGGDTGNMKTRVKRYEKSMSDLIKLTTESVDFISESALIAKRPVPPRVRELLGIDPNLKINGSGKLFMDVAKKAEDIIYKYIRATNQGRNKAPKDANDSAGFDRVKGLAEYVALEDLGFRGGIPISQRQSVRNRTLLRLGVENLGDAELDRHVAKYFAQGFARAIFGARAGSTIPAGKSSPLQTLSYSFLPYPPGTPSAMITNRVELAAFKKLEGNKVIPCWGGCAVVDYKGNKLQVAGRASLPESGNLKKIELKLRSGELEVDLPLWFINNN